MNYYNEFDPFAAAWLQQLIDHGLVPPGYIDTRSIKDVQPEDVRGFTQCHFFAGIGGWSYALALAGWPEDRPVWTGSCPCQPFSTAGKRQGVDDERDLWPEFARLIAECRPPTVFGEQVASTSVVGKKNQRSRVPASIQKAEPRSRFGSPRKISSTQAERAVRPIGIPPTTTGKTGQGSLRSVRNPVQLRRGENVGQPLSGQDGSARGIPVLQHKSSLPCSQQCDGGLGGESNARDCSCHSETAARLFQQTLGAVRKEFDEAIGELWIARVHADLEAIGYRVGSCDVPAAGIGAPHIRQRLYWVANTTDVRREQRRQTQSIEIQGERPERSGEHQKPGHAGELPGGSEGLRGASGVGNPLYLPGTRIRQDSGGMVSGHDEPSKHHHSNAWEESRWIECGDGRVRRVPTEPSLFPLAHGVPNQLGLLRGAGNAIVPPLAAEFIQAFEEARA